MINHPTTEITQLWNNFGFLWSIDFRAPEQFMVTCASIKETDGPFISYEEAFVRVDQFFSAYLRKTNTPPREFSLCKPTGAGSRQILGVQRLWCLRILGKNGKLLNVDGPSLCGRIQAGLGKDVVQAVESVKLSHLCLECARIYIDIARRLAGQR